MNNMKIPEKIKCTICNTILESNDNKQICKCGTLILNGTKKLNAVNEDFAILNIDYIDLTEKLLLE